MFAIVDIETCGSKFEFRKGRITDICIVIHDGLGVVDTFSTLINPECYIPPFYTRLTGITNEMVADAPRFHEVARHILEITEGCVFVAHNVSFDYSFVRDEFASLGYKYKRETLCTIRMARKLIPGRVSYSLGNLCESLGIPNKARHRAEGDALATAELFQLLLNIKANHPQYKNMGVDEIMSRRIDNIKKYILDKLPAECGVYYFLGKDGNIIYIGKSNNMHQRALAHFNSHERKGKKMLNELYGVDFVITGSELVALLLESEEIKKHKPSFNRRSRHDTFTHCIDCLTDEQGILNLKIVTTEQSQNSLRSFHNYASARERLEQWIDTYGLCIRFCGLTDTDSLCFNHQIKKCRGICAGEESPEEYNKSVMQIDELKQAGPDNYLIVDRGRHPGERSLVLVENRHYAGYGYADTTDGIADPNELRQFITRVKYYPDADVLLRGWMRNGKKAVKIPLGKI